MDSQMYTHTQFDFYILTALFVNADVVADDDCSKHSQQHVH